MKKILMFGTMLGVASATLAFGGVFNHGSKSSTYKGGVDAIGVHFGGEKKTADITADTPSCPEHSEWNGSACECNLGWTLNESDECTCPEERQCGDTCCGTGNICEEDESGKKWCCHEYYNENGGIEWSGMCCDASISTGYSTDDASCCATGLMAFNRNEDGDTSCCGDTIIQDGEKRMCCPAGSNGFDEDGCCPIGSPGKAITQELWEMWGGDLYKCCPAGTTIIIADDDIPVCCPAGSVIFPEYHCCPEGSTGYTNEDGCCPSGTFSTDNGHCCPEGSTGWASGNGCCEPGTSPMYSAFESYCCPEGSLGYTDNGKCCGEGNIIIDLDKYGRYCCPEGSTGFDLDSDECI